MVDQGGEMPVRVGQNHALDAALAGVQRLGNRGR